MHREADQKVDGIAEEIQKKTEQWRHELYCTPTTSCEPLTNEMFALVIRLGQAADRVRVAVADKI